MYMYQVYELMPNYTDFTQFKNLGIPGYNVGFIDCYYDYHRMTDTPETLNKESLQHLGEYAFSLIGRFIHTDLQDLKSPRQIFFNPLGSVFIYYPKILDVFFFTLSTILLILFLREGKNKKLVTMGKALKASAIHLIMMTLVMGITAFINMGVIKVHPLTDFTVPGGTAYPQFFFMMLMGISILSYLFLQWIFKRKIGAIQSVLGGIIIWWVLAATSFIFLADISYLFVLPLIFSSTGHLLAWRNKSEYFAQSGISSHIIITVFLIFPVFLFAPMIKAIFIATGITFLYPSVVLLLLLFLLLDPILIGFLNLSRTMTYLRNVNTPKR